MLRVISPRTPPRSWKQAHEKEKKRKYISHVLSFTLFVVSTDDLICKQGGQDLVEEAILSLG
jgi:hypothetical protein